MKETQVLIVVIGSALLTNLVTWLLLPPLRKLKGQTVREDLPERHRLKVGTPTLGGLAFLIVLPILLASLCPSPQIFICLAAVFSFASLGFADDWFKLHRKKGWRTQPKFAAQVILASCWIWIAWWKGLLSNPLPSLNDTIGFIFAVLLLLASVNGVNITDGLDGLAVGLTAIASVAVFILTWHKGQKEEALFASALWGACLGFLPFNFYPAKVFMGDLGSMGLGAGLGMVALLGKVSSSFLLIGLVFWIEQATVILQVVYFKWTKRRYGEGKRIFPMTPIHHSFELMGWSEPNIVRMFWLLAIIFAVLSLLVTIRVSS